MSVTTEPRPCNLTRTLAPRTPPAPSRPAHQPNPLLCTPVPTCPAKHQFPRSSLGPLYATSTTGAADCLNSLVSLANTRSRDSRPAGMAGAHIGACVRACVQGRRGSGEWGVGSGLAG